MVYALRIGTIGASPSLGTVRLTNVSDAMSTHMWQSTTQIGHDVVSMPPWGIGARNV
jgi:hypothetical protein